MLKNWVLISKTYHQVRRILTFWEEVGGITLKLLSPCCRKSIYSTAISYEGWQIEFIETKSLRRSRRDSSKVTTSMLQKIDFLISNKLRGLTNKMYRNASHVSSFVKRKISVEGRGVGSYLCYSIGIDAFFFFNHPTFTNHPTHLYNRLKSSC